MTLKIKLSLLALSLSGYEVRGLLVPSSGVAG